MRSLRLPKAVKNAPQKNPVLDVNNWARSGSPHHPIALAAPFASHPVTPSPHGMIAFDGRCSSVAVVDDRVPTGSVQTMEKTPADGCWLMKMTSRVMLTSPSAQAPAMSSSERSLQATKKTKESATNEGQTITSTPRTLS